MSGYVSDSLSWEGEQTDSKSNLSSTVVKIIREFKD